jgi:hypothetical protein
MVKLRQPTFVVGVAAALITAVLASTASFIASVPGRSRLWLWLPAPAVVVWMSTIGYGCLTDWVSIGPNGMSPGETARCFATLAITGIPLSLAMLLMLRYVARLAPTAIVMTGSLAVAAMTSAALSLFHPLDATVMIVMWNVGVAVVLMVFSGLYGRRLSGWVAPKG